MTVEPRYDTAAPFYGLTNVISGTEGDDSIRGTSGTDYLYGLGGNDTLFGLGGYDQLIGGAGDDLLFGGKGDDVVEDDDSGSDRLFGDEGSDSVGVFRHADGSPVSAEHVLLDGGAGDDWISINAYTTDGSAYAIQATLSGGDGNDTFNIYSAEHAAIDGGAGDDTVNASIGQDIVITLGEGADVLALEHLHDGGVMEVTDFVAGAGGDVLRMRDFLSEIIPGWQQDNPFGDGHLRLHQVGADTILQLDADGGADSWRDLIIFENTQASDFTAANLDNFPPDGTPFPGQSILGSAGDDTIDGTDGGDTIQGLGGADRVEAGAGDDLVYGGDGDDAIDGGLGDNTLHGGDGTDSIGATANSIIYGEAGDDWLYVNYFGAYSGVATLSGGDGADFFQASLASDVACGVVILGGAGDDAIFIYDAGRAVANGGGGDDHFDLYDVGKHTVLTLGAGSDDVRLDPTLTHPMRATITDFASGDGGDRLDLADFLATDLQGWDFTTNPFAAGYLRLAAKGASTLLQFSAQADGHWADLFLLRGVGPGDLTAQNLSGYPGDGSEPTGLDIVGDKLGDTIEGGIGPDTIAGGKGNDWLFGGAGDDELNGGSGADTLIGAYGSDLLRGGGGDDLLQEGSTYGGADTLLGGGGDDTIEVYRNFEVADPSRIVIDGGGGDDRVSVNAAPIDGQWFKITGGAGDDQLSVGYVTGARISGGSGADHILLGYASYTVDGGAGDDVVELNGGGVDIRVTLGAGADQVLFANWFELMYATAEVRDFQAEDSLSLAGFVASRLSAAEGDPFRAGYLRLAQIGSDTVLQANLDARGADWSDMVRLDSVDARTLGSKQLDGFKPGGAWLVGGDGHDRLIADSGFTHLDGGAGGDVLIGASTADVLIGGAGKDMLTGGGGVDVFVFTDVTDSAVTARDQITDLTDADVIDLSQIDANSLFGGDQAFVRVSQFDGHTNELILIYHAGSDTTILAGDVDGDAEADFEIVIAGDHASFANIVL